MSRRGCLLAALAAPLALLAGAWMIGAMVRSMIYPAPPVRVPSPPPAPLVEVPLAAGGKPVSAWWQPPSRPQAPVVLMLHGNGENLETMRRAGLFADFAPLGVGVLAVDYPGYGRSAGRPGEASNVAAALAGWRWLASAPEAAGRPRVVVGWSLGAAVAAQLAAAPAAAPVAGLALLSPWDTLAGVAAIHFPGWLVGVALPERYDTVEAAARIPCPSLVVHGEQDGIIPVDLGRRAFAALPEPKRWLGLAGAGHNDLLARQETWQALATFVAEAERRGLAAAAR